MSHFIDWRQTVYVDLEMIGYFNNAVHEIKRDLRERAELGHHWEESILADGRHTPVILRKTTDEEVKAGCGVLFIKNDGLIYFKDEEKLTKIDFELSVNSISRMLTTYYENCFWGEVILGGIRLKTYYKDAPGRELPWRDTTDFVIYESVYLNQDSRAVWQSYSSGYVPVSFGSSEERPISVLVIEDV